MTIFSGRRPILMMVEQDSLCWLGGRLADNRDGQTWAEEFRKEGIAANALWPRTLIATAAVSMIGGKELLDKARTPEIMADAAHVILTQPAREFTGNFCIDDVVLSQKAGVRDFSKYAVVPGTKDRDMLPDFFVPDDTPPIG